MANIPYPQQYDDSFINIFKRIIDELNSMGYTYEESLTMAKNILNEAKRTNDMNKAVDERLDNIIAESGTSSTEVIDARIDAEGTAYPVLKQRLDYQDDTLEKKTTASKIVTLDSTFQNKSSDGNGELVERPSWFTWDAPINIYQKDGLYYTDFDVSTLEPETTGQTYYVDAINGSDSNDGLTPETPFKRVREALLYRSDAGVIMVASGVYDRSNLSGSLPDKDVIIKTLPGASATFSCHDDLSWSLASGMTNTYQANRSSVDWVWDAKEKDVYGDNLRLTERASVADVESNPGSYYSDGTVVYVHTHDSRSLIGDTDIRVYLGTVNLRAEGGNTIYTEGISFEGGRFGVYNTPEGLNPLFLSKGCSFKYMHGNQQGGLELVGGDAYLQNCVAAKNLADGFNYHAGNGVTNRVIEVDCVGRFNGNRKTATNSDNGSTMHDGGQIIRLNGAHFGNEGPNIADVNDGTQSWNLGVIGLESRSDVNSADFRARGNMMMRLEGCVTNDPAKIETADGATIENNDVITNADIVSSNPMKVDVPSMVSGVVRLLNESIATNVQQVHGLQMDVQDLSTKTVHSSGENVNGRWIRFQDGTQIAVTSLVSLNGETFVAEGALYRSSNAFTVTFPNDFVGSTYQVMIVPRRLGGSGADNRVWASMYTSDSFMLYKTNDAALTDCGYVATIIGRWK